jgi:uncharacterized membrane protein YqjE
MTKETVRKQFSLERTALLARNRAFEDLPAFAIGAGILVGVNLLSLLVAHKAAMNNTGGQAWTFVICLAGFLLASSAFKGMHDGRSGTDWLLLPATNLEKYASALISYLFVLPLAASLAALGLSALLSLVELAAGEPGGRIWNPLSAFGVKGWIDYATACLVIAAGSATFRKRALIKTAGVAVVYVLAASGLFLAAMFLARKAMGLPVPDVDFIRGNLSVDGDFSLNAPPAVGVICDVARYVLIPVSAFLYGYFRVAEKEARDEVQ